ncbi:MAG: hypothetical protein OQK51_21480, partial [Kangiellaceae bacterium]|nr:hypothetical protein [Kangiellaceae bacterium]
KSSNGLKFPSSKRNSPFWEHDTSNIHKDIRIVRKKYAIVFIKLVIFPLFIILILNEKFEFSVHSEDIDYKNNLI